MASEEEGEDFLQRALAATDRVAVSSAFKKFDVDHSGLISADELGLLCAELGVELGPLELETTLRKLDADGSGQIELAEFEGWWTGRMDEVLGEKLSSIAAQGRRENHTDIYVASWNGQLELVEEFLSMDATLCRATDESEFGAGYTALHYASYAGHFHIVDALVSKYRAPVNATNGAGCTALFLASQQGHAEVVKLLLRHGARVNETEPTHGFSALDVASSPVVRGILLEECDDSPPPTIENAPQVSCPQFGSLEVSWEVPKVTSKSLPLQNHILELARDPDSHNIKSEIYDETDDSDAGNDDDDPCELASSLSQFKREVVLPGANPGNSVLTDLKNLPFPIVVRMATRNAHGQSEWSPWSASISVSGPPSVIEAPEVRILKKRTVEISWLKAQPNGCKITDYLLQGALLPSSALRRASTKPGVSGSLHKEDIEWEPIAVMPAKKLSKELEQMSPGIYSFRLIALNRMGRSQPGPQSITIRVV